MTLRGAVRLGASLALLGVLAWWLDVRAIGERLAGLAPGWAALALAISVPQMLISAQRWRYTAGRLGLDLPFAAALREYYVATFLNQVLPGGFLGDASRAVRHARADRLPSPRRAIHAVVLERASGQLVMTAVGGASLLTLPYLRPVLPFAIGVVALAALILFLSRRALRRSRWVDEFWGDARIALLARDAILVQLAGSALVVGSYVAMYVAAARAVGVDLPIGTLVPLVPPVLVSMLIPIGFAGWGVREATAAGLWGAVGLAPADGVAISAAYGLLVLLSTLPGALFVLRGGRDRKAG